MNREALNREMDNLGIEAIAVTSPENTQYFAGFSVRTQLSIRDRLVIGIVPREGTTRLLVCDIEESLARKQAPDVPILAYVEFQTKPVALLAQVLEEENASRAVIGVEYQHLTVEDFTELRRLMPHARFVPVDDALARVRAIKTPQEIEELTRYLQQTEEAVMRAWSTVNLGDSEKAIENKMRDSLIEIGAVGLRHCTVAIGENAQFIHHTAGNRELRAGDLVRSDFGGAFGRYGTDMARMGVGGKPSEELAAFYKSAYEVHQALAEMLSPGVIARDLYNRAADMYKERGIGFSMPHIGHSLRIDGGHENPILHPHNSQVLEVGMLIALEPVCMTPAGELCGTEDVYQITEAGSVGITGASDPSKLFQLGA